MTNINVKLCLPVVPMSTSATMRGRRVRVGTDASAQHRIDSPLPDRLEVDVINLA